MVETGYLLAGKLSRIPLFTYNFISGVTLTEDRTIKDFDISWYITDAIGKCDLESILTKFYAPSKSPWYETQLYIPDSSYSDAHIAYVQRLMASGKDYSDNLTSNALRKLPNSGLTIQTHPLTMVETGYLLRAERILNRLGFTVTAPIQVTDTLPKNALGMAQNDTIYLSSSAFSHGVKSLAQTILEEHIHLKTNFADQTRQLQDEFLRTIFTVAEHILGEPLE